MSESVMGEKADTTPVADTYWNLVGGWFLADEYAWQDKINAAIDAGGRFVLTGSKTVHTLDCVTIQDHLAVAETADATVSDTRRHHDALPGFDHATLLAQQWSPFQLIGPRAEVLTRAEVDALPSYRSCRTCAPAVSHQRKRGDRSMAHASVNRRHLQREFTDTQGNYLGTLEAITKHVSADRETTTLHFTDGRRLTLVGDDRIEMVAAEQPRNSAPAQS